MLLKIKFLKLILVLLLISALVMPSALPVNAAWVGLPAHELTSFTTPVNAHPLLLELASEKPDQRVDVIVQKAGLSTQPEELVERLGGHISNNLEIINAFSAEITAAAVQQLAASPAVRWVGPDTVMTSTACPKCIDTKNLANTYIRAIRADQIWNNSPYLQGQGIGVAIVDSGINPNGDLYTVMGVNRQVADIRFNTDYNQNSSDGYGHGTHIASVVGGDGSESDGKYIGVAPMVNIINVKISNDDGSATTSSVVQGLQWVLENKAKYNIRVVNLSLNGAIAESYRTSPLDAAVEILWFNKIVVVTSAGNQGSGAIYPPANDPFIITVGATNDMGTTNLSDDAIASFSAYGTTNDGVKKPDLVAPGKDIIARLVNTNMGLGKAHPSNIISGSYFKMSGTSVSAPIVSGAIALLLQDEPNLNPDQVKYRLMATANKSWPGYNAAKAGAGYLDVYAAVKGTTTETANSGIMASQLLSTGSQPITWGSVAWNSVAWNSVAWNSVAWNSVAWNSVAWNSDYWGP
jgi:serine protease AprX